MEENDLLTLTGEIVAAHVANNSVSVNDVAGLIEKVYASLAGLGGPAPAPEPEKKAPAVSIRASIRPEYIICLEDGKKLTMLKRYLRTNFSMSPEQYRTKWGLPKDYPMVAPNYAEKRRALAYTIGLGRKPKAVAAAPIKAPAKAKGANPPKSSVKTVLDAAKGHLAGAAGDEG